jgi:two-component system nitrate/nitrite response regulator NarL
MDERREAIRILIADDHPVFRMGLRKLLESQEDFQVVGEASDGEEALKLACHLKPEILLLDLSMPNLQGLEVLCELHKLALGTRSVILTVAIEKSQIVEALQMGAYGVVLKNSPEDVIVKSIRAVMSGQYWIGRESVSDLVRALLEFLPRKGSELGKRDYGVTPRERQVIALIVAGYTNKDMAHKLVISEETAKHHLTHIFDKLGVSNRLELVLFAINHQLIDADGSDL